MHSSMHATFLPRESPILIRLCKVRDQKLGTEQNHQCHVLQKYRSLTHILLLPRLNIARSYML